LAALGLVLAFQANPWALKYQTSEEECVATVPRRVHLLRSVFSGGVCVFSEEFSSTNACSATLWWRERGRRPPWGTARCDLLRRVNEATSPLVLRGPRATVPCNAAVASSCPSRLCSGGGEVTRPRMAQAEWVATLPLPKCNLFRAGGVCRCSASKLSRRLCSQALRPCAKPGVRRMCSVGWEASPSHSPLLRQRGGTLCSRRQGVLPSSDPVPARGTIRVARGRPCRVVLWRNRLNSSPMCPGDQGAQQVVHGRNHRALPVARPWKLSNVCGGLCECRSTHVVASSPAFAVLLPGVPPLSCII